MKRNYTNKNKYLNSTEKAQIRLVKKQRRDSAHFKRFMEMPLKVA